METGPRRYLDIARSSLIWSAPGEGIFEICDEALLLGVCLLTSLIHVAEMNDPGFDDRTC